MTRKTKITVMCVVVGFAAVQILLATGQWNAWTWLSASAWGIGAMGALEWERQTRKETT